MSRVVVIEDEADLRDILLFNLARAGHEVLAAPTGAEGLRVTRETLPELVLLDLMLPDMPGTQVCTQLRRDPATQNTRIIIVTAKKEEVDRVLSFELGADDYVSKPFSSRELLLRIQAVLKRSEPGFQTHLTVGTLNIDRVAHRVTVAGSEVALTALEFKLLVTLFQNIDRVQTREALLRDVWGLSTDIASRTVDTHVKRLREKLGTAGDYIETVRGVGYRAAAPSGAPAIDSIRKMAQ
ncbi:MAG TPA: winged helix-turn-helix domain-containing protein [Polyangiaceae bacterium]|nr:winged helix-turn-helix domain-containing protein [Polyangiaceae bacterium]